MNRLIEGRKGTEAADSQEWERLWISVWTSASHPVEAFKDDRLLVGRAIGWVISFSMAFC